MSGGHWDYIQYRFYDIAEDVAKIIKYNDPITRFKNNEDDEYDEYFDNYHRNYSLEVVEKLKQALKVIREAQIYITRIDYLLSGDDGQQTFLQRLEEELNKIN